MRSIMLSAAVAAAVLVWHPSGAAAAGCPANAFRESNRIWPFGTIATGQTKSMHHPCGKQLTCVGGKFGPPKTLRRCHWS